MHDDMQVSRLYEMDLCFKDGQFPCRWVPDMGYSYGYPLFNYYPPFPYYLGELFHLLGLGYIDSIKLLFFFGFLLSGFFMFLLGRKFWGDWGGLLSAWLYLWAPYHAVDVYIRGAMNEFWALVFLPGVYWSIYRLIDRDRVRDRVGMKDIALLALLFGLLLLSHNLMAFIFTPTFIAFALLLIWARKKNMKEEVIKLALGGLCGFCLAAFFTLPVLLEKNYVHIETMTMGYFNFLAHYVSLNKLLVSRYWGYGSSSWGQTEGMPFQVGWLHWGLVLLTLAGLTWGWFKKKVSREILALGCFFAGLFLLALFLIHPRSTPIWLAISLLKYLQFPWRFLTLVIFAASLLGSGIISLVKKEKFKILLMIFLGALTTVLNFNYFKPAQIIQITDEEKLFSQKGWNRLQTDAIFDYLPIFAQAPPAHEAPEGPVLKAGVAEIKDVKKGSNWYTFQVQVKEEALLEVPIYYFPGWKVWSDSQPLVVSYDNPLGLITVKVPPGSHLVKLKLTDTFWRTLGNLVSLSSWLILLLLVVRKIRRPRLSP